MVVVRVRVRALEARLDLELDQRQLLAAHLDRCDPVVRFESFSLFRLQEDRLGRRLAASRRRVDAVEAALLAAVAGAQVVGEAAVRRVKVQEDRARRRAEAVHDFRRRADECARLELFVLVVHEHGHAALEHVERVRVPAVEVRLGAVASVRKVRLRDAQLLEGRFQHDPPAEERLTFAGSQQNACHRARVCR